MFDLKEMAKKLKKLRLEHNLTLDELSAKTGLTVSALSYYESAKRVPSDENKCNIAKAYGMKVGEIFFDEK